MSKEFEIIVEELGQNIAAKLLTDEAPITCENFCEGLKEPRREKLYHGRETGPELWCFVSPPKEELPYENSTVFPEPGDILYYHYIQPPTRDGEWIFDIGIYYNRGCSKLRQGWIPGNLFAKVRNPKDIRKLEAIAGELLLGREIDVTLKIKK